jgi:hypothetical protein
MRLMPGTEELPLFRATFFAPFFAVFFAAFFLAAMGLRGWVAGMLPDDDVGTARRRQLRRRRATSIHHLACFRAPRGCTAS